VDIFFIYKQVNINMFYFKFNTRESLFKFRYSDEDTGETVSYNLIVLGHGVLG
jgi:hypothetical protein